MPKIFISYRRADTGDMALAIAKQLQSRFGRESIFYDIDSIRTGDFQKVIAQNLKDADKAIILIGEKWGTLEDANGNLRLHKADDVVSYEVEMALNLLHEEDIIPVRVNTDAMPDAGQLPSALQRIVRLNSPTVKRASFDRDMQNLFGLIQPAKQSYMTLMAVALLVLLILAGAIWFIANQSGNDTSAADVEQTVETVITDEDKPEPTSQPTNTDEPEPTESPSATPEPIVTTTRTRQFPCNAEIKGAGSSLNQVFSISSTNATRRDPVQRGSDVRVLDTTSDFGIRWYQIEYGDNTGWIDMQYLELSDNCPNIE